MVPQSMAFTNMTSRQLLVFLRTNSTTELSCQRPYIFLPFATTCYCCEYRESFNTKWG